VETITPTGHSYTTTAPPITTPTWIEVHPGVWELAA
jgi:hypothetical protein